MQNRSVTKLRVEVNLLSEFINMPKPPGVTAKEILESINDIHERLIRLNNQLRAAQPKSGPVGITDGIPVKPCLNRFCYFTYMNMTLKEIKAMFAVGQLWTVTREGNKPLTVHGNTGTSVLPALNGIETRKLIEVRSKELVFCCIDQAGRPNRYTPLPKASQVVEARPGFLKFTYDNGTTITMVLGETPSAQTV